MLDPLAHAGRAPDQPAQGAPPISRHGQVSAHGQAVEDCRHLVLPADSKARQAVACHTGDLPPAKLQPPGTGAHVTSDHVEER